MKRFFKIIAIIIAVFLLLLLAIPFLFQGKIKDAVLSTVNDNLESEVYVDDLTLSFFKNFPNASVSMEKFGIIGKGEFAGDTLADIGDLCVVVDVKSLFGDSYKIKKIEISDASLNAIINEKGNANWNIVKSDSVAVETEETEDTISSGPLKLDLALEKLRLKNILLSYNDMTSGMTAKSEKLNLELEGRFEGDMNDFNSLSVKVDDLSFDAADIEYGDSTLNMDIQNPSISFDGGYKSSSVDVKTIVKLPNTTLLSSGIKMLSNANLEADLNANVGLDSMKIILGENSIKINEITVGVSGFAQVIDSTSYDMDLTLNTSKIEFKDILSLIPAVYKTDFDKIKTDGVVSVQAYAKGMLNTAKDVLPSFDVKMTVENAMFKYPDLPKDVRNINILAQAKNAGGSSDNTELNISKFSFVMAGNPFDATLSLKTPVSDPDFDASVNGTIDFSSLKDVIKLDGTELNGLLKANVVAKGKYSYVENNAYDKFNVSGNANLANFVLNSSSFEQSIEISKLNMDFSTSKVSLTEGYLKMGKSDISARGEVKEFIPYILDRGAIVGNLAVSSNYLNIDELIGIDSSSTSGENVAQDTAEVNGSPIEIPDNVDFGLKVSMKEVLCRGIKVNSINGSLRVKDQAAQIEKLTANTMDGSVSMSGSYSTKNKKCADLNASMDINSMSVKDVFTYVNTAKAFAPILSNATGNFSMNIDLDSKVDENLSPIMNTINASGVFKTKKIGIAGSEMLDKISEKFSINSVKSPTFENLNVKFKIKDGRMTTESFTVPIGKNNISVSGSTGLDMTIDYLASTLLPESVGSSVLKNANLKIGGTFTNPTFSMDLSSIKDEIVNKVKETVSEVKNKALEEAKAKQKELLSNAQAAADKLKSNAKKQGEKLIEEAQAQADKQVKSAKNPIEKAAKKKAGEALVEQAKKKADKLNAEAEKQGQSLIDEAQSQSDKLIKEAESK